MIGGRKSPAGTMLDSAHQYRGKQESEGPAEQGNGNRLAQDHAKHVAVGESQRLEHAHLADALAYAHRHGVRGDQQNGERDRARYRDQEDLDVAQQGHKAEQVLLLALRLGLYAGIAILIVDGGGDAARRRRLIDQGSEDAGISAAALGQRLLQVVAVEVHDLAGARAVEDAANGELVIAREDVAHEGHAVADLQVVLGGQVAADHAAGAVALEGDSLVVGNLQVLEDGEDLVGIGGEAGEEILGVLIGAAEPLRDHHIAHAGDLFDLVLVGFRHLLGEGNLVACHDAQRLVRRGIAEVQGVVHGDHHAQQAHGDADARDSQKRAAAVPPAVLQNQGQKSKHVISLVYEFLRPFVSAFQSGPGGPGDSLGITPYYGAVWWAYNQSM